MAAGWSAAPATGRDWTDIAGEVPDAMITSTHEWVEHVTSDGRWADISRRYRHPDGRLMVLPLLRRAGRPERLSTVASLPPAAGFGGLVANHVTPEDTATVFADLDAVAGAAITVKPPPEQCEAWAAGAPASVLTEQRMTQILELADDFDTTFAERLPRRTRTRVRKGNRAGVEVERGTDARLIDDYIALHTRWAVGRAVDRHVPARLAREIHARRHPRSELDSLVDHVGTSTAFWVARHDDRVVAASIQLTRGAHSLFWRGCSDHDLAGPVEANYVLQARMIEHACASGCRRYHLGDSGGVESLAHFKRRFGADEVAHATFHIDRLPASRARRVRGAAIAGIERLVRRR